MDAEADAKNIAITTAHVIADINEKNQIVSMCMIGYNENIRIGSEKENAAIDKFACMMKLE